MMKATRRPPVRLGADAAGLVLGVAVDAVLGDPRRGHPVAVFGRVAAALERRLYADSKVNGAVFAGGCVAAAAALGLAADRLTRGRPLARTAVTAAATWAVLGGTSLGREAAAMARSLEAGDLTTARERLPHLCARDPAGLDAKALTRATVESIAENTSDASVAPLVWGVVAGVPGLLAYRAVNTLDAMVGYRNPRYANFGWAAARLDDAVNWLPARLTGLLTVACAPLVAEPAGDPYGTPGLAAAVPHTSSAADAAPESYQGRSAIRRGVVPESYRGRFVTRRGVASGWHRGRFVTRMGAARESYRMLRRDGGRHPSPNAGRCEAAFAGALGVRLGGVNVYGGHTEPRPDLGDGHRPEVPDLRRAVRLSRAVTLAATAFSAAGAVITRAFVERSRAHGGAR
jgi:adenosylcobinamide-phosphate synthase